MNTFDFSDPKLIKRKGIGFNLVEVARGGSLKIYNCLESVFKSYYRLPYVTKDYQRSNSWYVWDFYQANQLKIRLNKNLTQAFCFGLKFWPCLTGNQ